MERLVTLLRDYRQAQRQFIMWKEKQILLEIDRELDRIQKLKDKDVPK